MEGQRRLSAMHICLDGWKSIQPSHIEHIDTLVATCSRLGWHESGGFPVFSKPGSSLYTGLLDDAIV